ncbi:lipid A deacylase LpxR family protein [Stutzerimonas azotifigens]|uniref:Lipid A deacylase LpxR family protein n=1 Tax=Stutzerimonas azotifigens TaxID=291995 RepID=A0ABR5YV27_9GAMM|nr:lipid A deacylase LpxR family protein [Stutzerimonas azotifigens]MBA1271775.1 lipid A deacylase LpxR family protein [Stutzerimonas azotifigens]
MRRFLREVGLARLDDRWQRFRARWSQPCRVIAKFLKILPLLSLLAAPAFTSAEVLTFKVDNDAFPSGDDDHYTNGIEASWTFEPDREHWTQALASAVPGWKPEDLSGYVSYRFGHQMFTPEDIEQAGLQVDDRPYAGLIFGGITLYAEEQLVGYRTTSTFTLDLGLVGPATGGERLQRGVHELIDSPIPQGWSHQLSNEPFANLGYTRRWWHQKQFRGMELEFGPSYGGAVGNLYTYLSTGAGMRLGHNLPQSLDHASIGPPSGGAPLFQASDGFSWVAYGNIEGRYMAHNMLLDGNTFRDSHSVDRKDLVADVQVGLALLWGRWQLTLSNVWQTREFQEQTNHGRFGSLSISTQY